MVDPVLPRDDWGGAGLGWVRRSGRRAHRIQICHGYHANEIVITDRLEPAGGALAPGLEQNCLVTEWQDRILARVEEIIRAAEQAMGQPACD